MYEFLAYFTNMNIGHENDEPIVVIVQVDALGYETFTTADVWKHAVNELFNTSRATSYIGLGYSFDKLELLSVS